MTSAYARAASAPGAGLALPTPAHYRMVQLALGPTTGWEPLTGDFLGPMPGYRWHVSQCSFLGYFAVNALPVPNNSGGPAVGWFLIHDSAATETLADAVAGINLAARGLVLPMTCDQMVLGKGGFAFNCLTRLQYPICVHPGQTLRFLANINPGAVQPGPGAGSYGLATLQAIEERFA